LTLKGRGDAFKRGSATALSTEHAPDAVISKIAEKISAKLGVAPTLPKEQLIKDRMRAILATSGGNQPRRQGFTSV